MGENLPCTFPGEEIQRHYENHPKLAARFVNAAFRRRGIVCAVECPGSISEGEEVKILINNFDHPMQ
jgi:hypothetical protein